jgi:tetratricopeptide (TPR) repeat protein
MALGLACYQSGAIAQSIDAFRQALALARKSGDADDARLGLGRALMTYGRYADTISLARETLESGNADKRALAEFTWGTALSIEGSDLAGAMEHLQRALAAAPPGAATDARIRFEMGSIEAQMGDLPGAIALYQASLDAVKDAGPSDEEAMIWRILANNNLAYHMHLLGDPRAMDHAREGLRLAQERGQLTLMMYLLSTLGEIALAGGDLDEAEAGWNSRSSRPCRSASRG